MIIEKEVIRPGTYWYRDEKTGKPRKLVVTPEMTHYWHEQGNKMLSCGLTVPVPCEHDFDAHPMSPADKLKNNAGWVKQYKLHDGKGGKGDRLFSVVKIEDESLASKLPRTIKWTSPWINSFVDGNGREWNNVISHLALTTRPRIIDQDPFPSIAAALSLATPMRPDSSEWEKSLISGGFCLSGASELKKVGDQLRPRFPIAFSLCNGIKLAADDMMPPKKGKGKPGKPAPDDEDDDLDLGSDEDEDDMGGPPDNDADDMPAAPNPSAAAPPAPDTAAAAPGGPMGSPQDDIKTEEVLCDLLQALGVPVPDHESIPEGEFKRHLYEAAFNKIKEIAGKHMNPQQQPQQPQQQQKPGQKPGMGQKPGQALNPLIQQEQQPMYMSTERPMASLSLDDINRIEDPTFRTVALSMFNDMQQLREENAANRAKAEAMQNMELQKATKKRQERVAWLARLSPKVKDQLEAMLSLQSMALSIDTSGTIVDPMKATLDMLETGLANLPRLMTTDQAALTIHPQPTDADLLSAEGEAKLVDDLARMMGAAAAG